MLQAILRQFQVIAMLVSLETRRRAGSNISETLEELYDTAFLMMLMIGLRLLAGATAHRGMEIAPFVASGLVILLGFRSSFGAALGTPKAFMRLQSSIKITVLDMDIARTIVDFLLYAIIAVVLFAGLIAAGLSSPPEDPVGLFEVLFLGSLFGLVLGQVFRSLFPDGLLKKILISVVSRGAIWFSGAFFVAAELPYAWRDTILLNPLVQLTEMARTYYFHVYTSDHLDSNYLMTWIAVLFVSGLVTERATRHQWTAA